MNTRGFFIIIVDDDDDDLAEKTLLLLFLLLLLLLLSLAFNDFENLYEYLDDDDDVSLYILYDKI